MVLKVYHTVYHVTVYDMYAVPEGGGKPFTLQFLSANDMLIVSKETMHRLVIDLSLTSSQY